MAKAVRLEELGKGIQDPEVVLATLKEYAESGEAISSKIVIDAISTSLYSQKQLEEARSYLLSGANLHLSRTLCGSGDELIIAIEYAKAFRYTDNSLPRDMRMF
jgi:hypothetical protein